MINIKDIMVKPAEHYALHSKRELRSPEGEEFNEMFALARLDLESAEATQNTGKKQKTHNSTDQPIIESEAETESASLTEVAVESETPQATATDQTEQPAGTDKPTEQNHSSVETTIKENPDKPILTSGEKNHLQVMLKDSVKEAELKPMVKPQMQTEPAETSGQQKSNAQNEQPAIAVPKPMHSSMSAQAKQIEALAVSQDQPKPEAKPVAINPPATINHISEKMISDEEQDRAILPERVPLHQERQVDKESKPMVMDTDRLLKNASVKVQAAESGLPAEADVGREIKSNQEPAPAVKVPVKPDSFNTENNSEFTAQNTFKFNKEPGKDDASGSSTTKVNIGEKLQLQQSQQQTAGVQKNADNTAVDMEKNVEQVVKAARTSLARGSASVQIRLEPPDLGYLRVEIRQNITGLQVQLQATNAKAQQLLQQHSSELQAALEANGIPARHIDVQLRLDLRNDHSFEHDSQAQQQDASGQQGNTQEQFENDNFNANSFFDLFPEDEAKTAESVEPKQATDPGGNWQRLDFAQLDVTV